MIVWITGAPGAGKTTLSKKMQKIMPHGTLLLDGDEVRTWLTPDCDFSAEGRARHACRVYEFAQRVGNAIVAVVAHPPGPVDLLVLVEGPNRRPLWAGTSYVPPANPDLVVSTHG